MDNTVLRKRLSTFKSSKGNLIKVSDDLLFDVIRSWEAWSGTSTELARELGIHVKQLAFIVRKAKKLHREGKFPVEDFKEIKVQESPSNLLSLTNGPCSGVEILWENGKLIRFQQVEQLIDFLKKVA
jgi:hypothetical protein